MTSSRKIEANRNNARRSTGPKTAAGKARASKNALRHGLSVSVIADPVKAKDIAALIPVLAGARASDEANELAARIAEAQIDLVRVREARHQLVAYLGRSKNGQRESEGPQKFALILSQEVGQLAAMDRYERRALSRRKFAIRALDEARQLLRDINNSTTEDKTA